MEHSAVLLTCIKIPNGFQAFVLSIFEWPLKTGFTVSYLYDDQKKIASASLKAHFDINAHTTSVIIFFICILR